MSTKLLLHVQPFIFEKSRNKNSVLLLFVTVEHHFCLYTSNMVWKHASIRYVWNEIFALSQFTAIDFFVHPLFDIGSSHEVIDNFVGKFWYSMILRNNINLTTVRWLWCTTRVGMHVKFGVGVSSLGRQTQTTTGLSTVTPSEYIRAIQRQDQVQHLIVGVSTWPAQGLWAHLCSQTTDLSKYSIPL